jgi:ribosomal protein L39E
MSSNKSEEKKEFLISTRKKIAPGVTNAPFWVMQKKGGRIWNARAKRHWRQTDLGNLFEKKQKEQKEVKKTKRKSRKIKRTVKHKLKKTGKKQ